MAAKSELPGMMQSVTQGLYGGARRHLFFEDMVEVRIFILRVESEVPRRRGLLVEVD